jgi:hypothetical protein
VELCGIVTLADGFPQTGTVNLTNLAGGLGTGLNARAKHLQPLSRQRSKFVSPAGAVERRHACCTRNSLWRIDKRGLTLDGFNILNRVNYSTVNATQYSLQRTNLVPNPLFMKPQAALSYPAVGNLPY